MQSENIETELQKIAASLYRLEIIAKEIIDFTNADECQVWKRICLEMEQVGYNVSLRAKEYGVTPHIFDENMLKLYKESDGFIYETLVESRNPVRVEKWLNIAKFLLSVSVGEISKKKVLMYGDSVGSDSIFLKQLGFDVYYHDLESYCSSFANYRFHKRGLNIKKITNFTHGEFDFVICLEVAEHVVEPRKLINELNLLTSENGYCIFSEAFQLINESFPTHLKSNLEYAGKTDELFREVGMNVLWRDIHNKPVVYTKWSTQKCDYSKDRRDEKIAGRFKHLIKKVIKL